MQIENRYRYQSGILEGDILFTVGAAVEDGSYQGAALQQLMSLDTSCRKKFGKLARNAKLELEFKGMPMSILIKSDKTNPVWNISYMP